MQRSDIEYLTHAWNPVTGCHHTLAECAVADHCWARAMARRFGRTPESREFRYQWHEDAYFTRFPRQPARIGVCFTGDLWGNWNQQYVQERVVDRARWSPQHTFLFLTKAPHNYVHIADWPANAWVGASATDCGRMSAAVLHLSRVQAPVKWLSLEPMLGAMPCCTADALKEVGIRWVIIGAQTGPGAVRPELEWVTDIMAAADEAGAKVFLKDNLLKLYPELPQRQELP